MVVSEDGKTGKAARLESLDTTGMDAWITSVPKVTSGSVFSGTFVVDPINTLKSTKFGYPCFKKPVAFKGSYKFTAGATYYTCPDPSKAHIFEKMIRKKICLL